MPDAGRWVNYTRTELQTERARTIRISRWINRALWGIAAGVMVYGAGNVTALLLAHHTPWPTAWLLSGMVDLGLCVALWSDRILHSYGRSSGWLIVLRWVTAAMTWMLNVAGNALHRDWVGVAIHSCGPVLLVVVAESAGAIQRHVAAIVADIEAALADTRSPARTAAAPKPAPTSRSRRSKDQVVEDLVARMRADPSWSPDYPALMSATGYGRSWCEKRVGEARVALAAPRLHAVAAQNAETAENPS